MREYIQYLKLKRPVQLTVLNRANNAADAEYETEYYDNGKICQHLITIWNNPESRDFNALVAHELIHAWQAENDKDEIHGKYFVRLARQMESKFGLREVYLSGIDEE